MYYVGFDIGTSSLKCMVIDDACHIVYEHGYSYTFDEPYEGYREIDPNIWFQMVEKGLYDIFQTFGSSNISVIGVTGQMHTTVFLDVDGKPIRKAIMWNDVRSKDMLPHIKTLLSQREDSKYINKIISTGSMALNTLWLKKHEPKAFSRIHKIMSAYDYIVYRLSGNYSCDYCDASTSSLYDIVTKKWSAYMLDLIGIDEQVLGPIYASCDVVGTLLSTVCAHVNRTHPIRVIAGTGDNPANAVALDILHQQQPVISLGTSGVVIIVKEDKDFEGKGKNVLYNEDHNHFVNVVQGTVRSAGGAHKWWMEHIVECDDMKMDQERVSDHELGANDVLFFPHITGDKMIYQDITTRGAFVNLSVHTKREDMLQAVFEGVAYALREVMENMNLTPWPKRIQINGGGSKSDVWMKIMSHILHSELQVVTTNASPGYGVALLASQVDKIKRANVKHTGENVYIPCSDKVEVYEKRYRKYQKMYGALKEIMRDEPIE